MSIPLFEKFLDAIKTTNQEVKIQFIEHLLCADYVDNFRILLGSVLNNQEANLLQLFKILDILLSDESNSNKIIKFKNDIHTQLNAITSLNIKSKEDKAVRN